jgi:hypothetical protein
LLLRAGAFRRADIVINDPGRHGGRASSNSSNLRSADQTFFDFVYHPADRVPETAHAALARRRRRAAYRRPPSLHIWTEQIRRQEIAEVEEFRGGLPAGRVN